MSTEGPAQRRPARPTARATALLAAGLLVVGLTGCGDGDDASGSLPPASSPQTGAGPTDSAPPGDGDPAPAGPTGDLPALVGTEVATLEAPTVLLPRPGDDDHLYVAERAGRVRRLATTGTGLLVPDGEAVLDLSDQTTTDAERGLLGLAFSADGDTLYASHTDADGNSRVASYAMDGAVADADTREELVAVDQPYPNHNGGNLVLGPDGLLWLGLGDGGSSNDPDNRAQDPATLLGKLVRIDPATGDTEIVAGGLRNPWRFSFDADDSLWIADVGQGAWEEVDHVAFDDIEGTDFGWSAFEGTHENPDVDPEGRASADPVPPVFEYSHDDGNCSITGGFVYRGTAIPELQGAYLFADYCAGDVRAISLDADGRLAREHDLGIHLDEASSFGIDQAGELYVLSDGGQVVRIEPAP